MSTNRYQIGNTTLLTVSFANAATGTPVDPSSVTLRVLMPGQSSAVVYVYGSGSEIQKTSVGNYSAEIILNASGLVNYRWEAGGAYPGAIENSLRVLPSNIVSG